MAEVAHPIRTSWTSIADPMGRSERCRLADTILSREDIERFTEVLCPLVPSS